MKIAALSAVGMLALGAAIAAPASDGGTKPSKPDAARPPSTPAAPPAPARPTSPTPPMSDTPPNTLSAEEEANGWVLLFDGIACKHLRGYRKEDMPDGWTVRDGQIVRTGPGGDLVTRSLYQDFEFVCDWKVQKGGNSGIMWHVSEDHEYPWQTGPEMQILDDAGHVDGRTPFTSAGACYALYPAPEGAVRPAGEWNRARILVQGPKVELWLNGVQTASFDTSSADWKERIAKSKFKDMPHFATKDRGRIALQDHGDEVAFRNIKVRPIQ